MLLYFWHCPFETVQVDSPKYKPCDTRIEIVSHRDWCSASRTEESLRKLGENQSLHRRGMRKTERITIDVAERQVARSRKTGTGFAIAERDLSRLLSRGISHPTAAAASFEYSFLA